jgi:hypothetical protein
VAHQQPQREINHYVDITATFDRKVAAVRRTQARSKTRTPSPIGCGSRGSPQTVDTLI